MNEKLDLNSNHRVELNGKVNYVDFDGDYISDEWFDVGFEFSNFRALVGKKTEYSDNILYNYLDINGKLILGEGYSNKDEIDGDMSYELSIGGIFIGTMNFSNGLYTLINSDTNLLIENIGDIDVFDDDYYIKDNKGKSIKGKGILKIYLDGKENIYSLDSNTMLFEEFYEYIKIPKVRFYKMIFNYIVLDKNDKYYLSDLNGKIISKAYDDISLGDSIANNTMSITIDDEFNFLDINGNELSDIWFDDCKDFTFKEFTKVMKGENINYFSKKGKLLTDIWFDKLIHFNEGYAIIEVNNNELVVGDYGNFEFECKLENNKYFQDSIVYDNYIDDKEFISLLVYLDYHLAKSYDGPHAGMRDFTLGFKNVEKTLNILMFILTNYSLYENKYSFLNEKEFENKYHDKFVGRREGIISSAIYYLIESSDDLKNKYNSNKYRNLSLTYMHYFITDLIQQYQDENGWSKEDAENQILDVVYRENVYLFYGEGEWTPFCTGGYLDCIKE